MVPFSGSHHTISNLPFPGKNTGILRQKTEYLIKLIGHIHKENFQNSYHCILPCPWCGIYSG
jgi:hypothetical protein